MTQQVQLNPGTALKFNGEAGADVAFSMESVANLAGRVSVQYDLGATPRDFQFYWHAEALWQATPTQYGTLDFYLATAPDNDSTMISGDVGATDAALGDLDQLRNLTPLGQIICEEANTTKMVGKGSFTTFARYITIVGVNNGGSAINATDSNFIFNLVPYNLQGQDT